MYQIQDGVISVGASHHLPFTEAGIKFSTVLSAGVNQKRGCSTLPAWPPFNRFYHDEQIDQTYLTMVANLVGFRYSIKAENLLGTKRGSREIARARQISMYLLHTSLSIPYHQIATMFSRDRTTVTYACRVIEDLRDDKHFDCEIAELESLISPLSWMKSRNRMHY